MAVYSIVKDIHPPLCTVHLQAIEKMRGEVPDSTLEVEFAPLDLSSFKSTVSFADWFLGKYDKLNILCCNAGYLGQNYRESPLLCRVLFDVYVCVFVCVCVCVCVRPEPFRLPYASNCYFEALQLHH